MCKFLFAVFTPLTIFLFGIFTGRIKEWLKSPHLYISAFVTLFISSIWFIYFETLHRGYLLYLLKEQVFQRIQEGADVKKGTFMYFREFLLYYHPWLIILVLGIPQIIRKIRKDDLVILSITGFLVVFIPLQISTGKASRYLIPLTPFLSILVATSILNLDRIKDIILKSVKYLVFPILIFFWIVPIRINPEKYQVIHFAKRLSENFTVDYRHPFAFLQKDGRLREDVRFVFLKHGSTPREQMRLWYFYLSDRFEIWDEIKLYKWGENGGYPLMLLTTPDIFKNLRLRDVRWIEISKDRYNILLGGMKMDSWRRQGE